MSEDNKTVVRRFAGECWDKRDFDVADELVAGEVIRNGGVGAQLRSALGELDGIRLTSRSGRGSFRIPE